jgi:tetratricopeptide (TPR) repeat protein
LRISLTYFIAEQTQGEFMSKKQYGPALLVILGLIFIATIGLRSISTPEIWTHLAQGKINAPISFVASDSAVNTTWLYDKLAYTAWNIGKAPLLIVLNIAGLLTTFILLLQVSKKWGGPVSQGFALLIAGQLIFQSIDVGPQVIMMLGIATTLYLTSTLKKQAVLFASLIPLQILWTNMHSSFIYGPLIVALVAAQTAQQKSHGGRTRKKQGVEVGTYAILALAMLLATAINPYFFKMHWQAIANLKAVAPAYWSSLFIDYFQIQPLKPLILFVMILGAGGLITLKKKLPLTLTTLAIYSAFLLWTSPKMSLLFVAMAFPFIVLSLTAISEYIRNSLEHILGKNAKFLTPATSTVFILLIIMAMVPVVSNCAYINTGSASNFGMGIQEELYPSGAETIITDPAFPEKAINLAADGGYLAFKYNRKVFIDYRSGRYSEELLKNLNATLVGDRTAYNKMIEEYRPEAFIINTLHPSSAQGILTLLAMQSEGINIWQLAHFDGITAILLLNKPQYKGILNNAQAQAAGLARLEAARMAYASQVGSCRAGNPAELIGSGKVFLAFNRPTEAKAVFSLLLQNNKHITGAWIGLGRSQLMLKEFEMAAASLKTATELSPKNLQAWFSYARACNMCAQRVKDPAKQAQFKHAFELAQAKYEQLKAKLPEEKEEPAEPAEAPVTAPKKSLKDLTDMSD